MPSSYRPIIILFLALIPLIVSSVLLYLLQGQTLFDIYPTGLYWWNDQIFYWLQSRTFAFAGFDGGYFTVNEVPAPLSFTRFYFWGPVIPMIYGGLGKFFATNFWSIIVLNVIFLMLAIIVFLSTVPLNRWQTIAIAITLAGYAPLIYFFPTMMIEVLNYAIAIVLATAFYHLIKTRSWLIFFMTLALIVIAGFIRTTWMLFILPMCVYGLMQHRQTMIRFILGIVLGSIAFLLFMGLQNQLAAPFPNAFTFMVDSFSEDPIVGFKLLLVRIWRNVVDGYYTNGLEKMQYLQALIIILLPLKSLFDVFKEKQFKALIDDEALYNLLIAFTIISIISIIILLYEVAFTRGFRVLSPHILLAILLIIIGGQRRVSAVLMGTVIISLFWLIQPYQEMLDLNYGNPVSAYETQLEETSLLYDEIGITYDEQQENVWCNTVLVSTNILNWAYILSSLEPELGVSIILGAEGNYEIGYKSQYLIVGRDTYDLIENVTDLTLLHDFDSNNKLYHNMKANC